MYSKLYHFLENLKVFALFSPFRKQAAFFQLSLLWFALEFICFLFYLLWNVKNCVIFVLFVLNPYYSIIAFVFFHYKLNQFLRNESLFTLNTELLSKLLSSIVASPYLIGRSFLLHIAHWWLCCCAHSSAWCSIHLTYSTCCNLPVNLYYCPVLWLASGACCSALLLAVLPILHSEASAARCPTSLACCAASSSISCCPHCKDNLSYVFLFLGIARPQSQFPHSCVFEHLHIPRVGPHISCSRIGRSIVGMYKSLADTRMWKLGLWPRNSVSRNICIEFLALVLCSAPH